MSCPSPHEHGSVSHSLVAKILVHPPSLRKKWIMYQNRNPWASGKIANSASEILRKFTSRGTGMDCRENRTRLMEQVKREPKRGEGQVKGGDSSEKTVM